MQLHIRVRPNGETEICQCKQCEGFAQFGGYDMTRNKKLRQALIEHMAECQWHREHRD